MEDNYDEEADVGAVSRDDEGEANNWRVRRYGLMGISSPFSFFIFISFI